MSTQIKDTSQGYFLGGSASEPIALHGATPVVQRTGAAQAVVTGTVPTAIAAFTDPPSGAEMVLLRAFVNALKVDVAALIVLTNELRAALVAKGVISGAA